MNFVLIGAAGYIAPRHMKAIKEVGGDLLASVDPHDSVGILDQFFPHCAYFREFERFDRHVERLLREGVGVDYVVVCSPNYLHDAHCRFGLRVGAKVICEKPLVINPDNLSALQQSESESDGCIFTILQTRLHPSLVAVKNSLRSDDSFHKVKLSYHSYRGPWYDFSWKGNVEQSGGLLMNIGIHFFDVLLWLFGKVEKWQVVTDTARHKQGSLLLEKAHVDWELSVNSDRERVLTIDGTPIDFTQGFESLHTLSYREVMSGDGFRIEDARSAIDLVGALVSGERREHSN